MFCPSVDGHLCCFHLLALVNNAAVKLAYKCLSESLFFILSCISLGVEWFAYPGQNAYSGKLNSKVVEDQS